MADTPASSQGYRGPYVHFDGYDISRRPRDPVWRALPAMDYADARRETPWHALR